MRDAQVFHQKPHRFNRPGPVARATPVSPRPPRPWDPDPISVLVHCRAAGAPRARVHGFYQTLQTIQHTGVRGSGLRDAYGETAQCTQTEARHARHTAKLTVSSPCPLPVACDA